MITDTPNDQLPQSQKKTLFPDLTQSFLSTSSADQITEVACDYIYDKYQPDLVILYLSDEQGVCSQYKKQRNHVSEEENPNSKQVGEYLYSLAMQEKSLVFSENYNDLSAFQLSEGDSESVQSFVAIPLLLGDGQNGVLGIGSVAKRNFSTESELFTSIGEQITTALRECHIKTQADVSNEQLLAEINQLKTTVADLSAKNDLFNNLFEHVPMGITVWDNKGYLVYANRGFTSLTGYTSDDLNTLDDWFALAYPDVDDREMLMAEWISASSFTSAIREFKVTCKNSQIKRIDFNATFLSNGWVQLSLKDVTTIHKTKTELQKQTKRYQALSDAAFEAMFISIDGRCIDANKAAEKMFGYSRKEIVGMYGSELMAPQSRQLVKKNILSSYNKTYEATGLKKDGTQFHVEIKGLIAEHGDRSVRITVVNDISKYKKAEKELKESEDILTSLFASAPVGIGLIIQQTITKVNHQLCEMLGYTEEDLLDQDMRLLHATEKDFEYVEEERYRQMMASGIATVETRWLRKDGSLIDVLLSSSPIDQQDWRQGITFSALDITERKRFEETLQFTQFAIDHSSDAAFWMNSEAQLFYVNQAACKILGYERDELIGMSVFDFTVNTSRTTWPSYWQQLKEEGFKTIESQLRNGDGEILPVEIMDNFIRFGGQEYNCSFVRDISERKKAELLLNESEDRFRTLIEKCPLGISLIGEDGKYEYINPEFTKIFGYTLEDISTGQKWFEKAFPDPDYRKKVKSTWLQDQGNYNIGVVRPRTFTVTTREGKLREIHFRPVTLANLNQFVIYEDITERTELEEKLQQAQKMEAIGTLAGGIAHDFNNILMGVIGRTTLMMSETEQNSPHYEHLESIEDYVNSASNLTRQLLGFARGGKYQLTTIDLNDLAEKSALMFGRTRKDINLRFEFAEQLEAVEVDCNQIEQVLLNLYVNAWQAMPEGGDLHLKTENVTLGKIEVQPYDLQPGKFVRLSVTDTGRGMDEETTQKIFEPFFTTKGMGRGTGLGLASSYGIMDNHGGFINVISRVGEGSTFQLHFPTTQGPIFQEEKQNLDIVTGTGRVLLVDDEEMIREVGQRMLEQLGYTVETAKSGEHALELVSQQHGQEFDLVILDMVMPEMSGGETYDRLKNIKPEVKVLLSSGYSLSGQAASILARGCEGFIQKPFNLLELSSAIQGILTA